MLNGCMALTDDARTLMDLYPRIFHACHVRHVRDERLRRTLSAHQASILDHLDDVEPTSMTSLAQHMGVTASTMSLAIDRLEQAGYVRRGRDAADGRRVLLRLTRHGLRIKKQEKVLDPQHVRDLLAELDMPIRADALRGLALLARAAGQAMVKRRSRERESAGGATAPANITHHARAAGGVDASRETSGRSNMRRTRTKRETRHRAGQ